MPRTQQTSLPRNAVDKSTGLVKVWDKEDKKWKAAFPVDAREQVAQGTANLDGPDVELQGPEGRKQFPLVEARILVKKRDEDGNPIYRLVNEADANYFRGLVNVEKEIESKKVPPTGDKGEGEGEEGEGEEGEEGDEGVVVDFSQYNLEQLHRFAEDAGIQGHSRMNKPDLVKALDEAEYEPSE